MILPSAVPLADTNFVESTGVMIVKCVVIFAVVLGLVPMILLLERKLLGRFQNRYGPNRVGPYGLLQPLADVLKLLGKEQFYPRTGVPFLMALAPAIMIVTAIASLAIIPFGDVKHGLGAEYGLYGIDVNIGILYAFAFGSLAFYGLMLGGWASGSKYSFLGAMRSAAQLVSYEVSLGLSLIGVVMMAGSLSLVSIVQAQHAVWYVLPQFVGFLIFTVAGFAETNRPPFDLPEADAELVGGYNTEFGGMRFGSFFMAEYMNMFVISGLAAAMFLGGWRGPGPGYLDPVWMLLKILAVIVFFIWIRATVPRLRYDQLMSFGWKVLLPLATLNLLVTATLVALL
jgi:NADH-quinone oxidoreductase subunit H